MGPDWGQEVSSGSACPLLGGRCLLPCPCRAGAVTERRSLARTERLGDGFKHEIITTQKSHIKAFNFTPGTLLSLSEILIEDRQMSSPPGASACPFPTYICSSESIQASGVTVLKQCWGLLWQNRRCDLKAPQTWVRLSSADAAPHSCNYE